jgi:SchA/CurD like domain-containing protein
MERHAITFPIRPGSEAEVARILSGYAPPRTEIDEHTKLLATSVFLWRARVVRVMDVQGALPVVMRHLAQEPAIRAVEEQLNPYLAEPRDLTDPQAARAFFTRSMMRRIAHRVTDPADIPPGERTRVGLRYPVRAGCGDQVAEILSGGSALPVRAAQGTALASTTVFQQGDLVVRMAEFAGDVDQAGDHLGRKVSNSPDMARLTPLLEPGYDLTTVEGFERFFAEQRLTLVTTRRAAAVAR